MNSKVVTDANEIIVTSESRSSVTSYQESSEVQNDSQAYDDSSQFDTDYSNSKNTSISVDDSTEAEVQTIPTHQQELHVKSDGSQATLTLNTWTDGEWVTEVSMSAYIGSNGISSSKTEGDRCTPAGTYNILFCFGLSQPQTNLSFIKINEGDVWVCDSNSSYYNTLQSNYATYKDWSSTEDLYKKFSKSRSNYCIYFDFNGDGQTPNATKKAGSDLFIDGVGSAGKIDSGYGDIKISSNDMLELLSYLDSNLQPVVIIE